ncbi:MAG: hypothetical protein GY754_26145 [bacterium]|nr:hypothetical protein [bacterium]
MNEEMLLEKIEDLEREIANLKKTKSKDGPNMLSTVLGIVVGVIISLVVVYGGMKIFSTSGTTVASGAETAAPAGIGERVGKIESILKGVTRKKNDIIFSGMNLNIVNGTGSTGGPVNGLGNLVVGYNEPRYKNNKRAGSHNIVVGIRQNFSSYGCLVAGEQNNVFAAYSAVTGGSNNSARSRNSSVTGGTFNHAIGRDATVSGGSHNTAISGNSSVSGGSYNRSKGLNASIAGGTRNLATGLYASISGGMQNQANGDNSSVSGGAYNVSRSLYSSVSGGIENRASGDASSVSGGYRASTSDDSAWKAGELSHTP